jgi:hypothetical protein
MHHLTTGNVKGKKEPEAGNAILLSLLLVSLLAALATAQFSIVHKNTQASDYFGDRAELRKYAESGMQMAIYDLENEVTANGGKVGTLSWSSANDLGADGQAGTADSGEGDGIPTFGEPNLAPVSVGSWQLAASMLVYVTDTAWADVKRVVSTVRNNDATVTLSSYVKSTPATVPQIAAVYVDPDVTLDLKGNKFTINGTDHKMDGTPLAGGEVPGLATSIGSPPGTNEAFLLAQVSSKWYDQILGLGGTPSVDEVGSFDVYNLFEAFKANASNTLAPGTYTSPTMGTTSNMMVTHVTGDLHLSGIGKGAGVLLVEGSVTITGQFEFKGMVIVLGDVRLSGGGAGVHIYGSLMVGESITAIDTDTEEELEISGNADVYYSSEALANVEQFLGSSYTMSYYEEL